MVEMAGEMAGVTRLPHRPQPDRQTVAAFTDTRGNGRGLRVTWHHEPAPHGPVVVLSLWREDACTGTFRLRADEVAAFVAALEGGAREAAREA